MEDLDQNIYLKNLFVYVVVNEEEVFNFLFLGDINRMIVEVSIISIEYVLYLFILKIFNSDLELILFGF